MARKKRTTPKKEVQDYRHDAKRKNNPPAGIAAQGKIQEKPKQEYSYNPHLPPNLRFDPNGDADKLPELLEEAQQRPLTAEETKTIADALKQHEPWLEWSGKQKKKSFTADPVALHIHERVSAKAILKVAARENVQRSLFADPQQDYAEAVDFYQHDVDWANRLILGDSLTVMSSLAHREDLAGKVQMIYIDPPYGIKFASNFQPTVFQYSAKNSDKDQDLTREPEQIKAYRDTWSLGIHSYLAYLRDRLYVAKDLLHDNGSIFLQINDEHAHLLRNIMDEVFERENFIAMIYFQTAANQNAHRIQRLYDVLLWYKKTPEFKFHQMFKERTQSQIESVFTVKDKISGEPYKPMEMRFSKQSEEYKRLAKAERLTPNRNNWMRCPNDFPYVKYDNVWTGTVESTFSKEKIYVVQTNKNVIQRCILMTTDPGDLVLDPTCGGGTTAFVAEQWGRRWITIDTSRVAIALARQRLLTGSFDYYKLKDEVNGVAGGFVNETVPQIKRRSITENTALDPIFEKHEPILTGKLETLNNALANITPEIRTKLHAKLAEKERREGKRSITDADRRRWQLPDTAWQEWEVPFDTDPDWPEPLQEALTDYRNAWRAKMDEVNKCIADVSECKELVDQPIKDSKRIRVSGPFTVEAVQPAEESLDLNSPIGGEPEDPTDTFEDEDEGHEAVNAEAYLDKIIRLLKNDGVKFPDNKTMKFATLDPLEGDVLHAEGHWEDSDADQNVAVVFGPQHGPVTVMQVEDCLPIASRRGYSELVFAGFSFDDAAQAVIQKDPNPRVRIHMAYINPDVAMDDLLKETPTSQLFTVFGLPRTELKAADNGEFIVKMKGVDIYNPVDNTVNSAGADKVAAWFIDSDYNGRDFCITQAFFPDKKAWDKIARDLKSVVDPECFEKFSGTESLPFPSGEHACAAVKVIDPRGNEVMRVHNLRDLEY
ncbi:site-specific DNA-methyltransferase [Candidatus Poribacteria bacterium]|nr:site-specific DNA-methyltransferase [Candidatus Poribacteria bacterium]